MSDDEQTVEENVPDTQEVAEDITASPTSADEMPKKDIADKVVARKRRYFFPEHDTSVRATSLAMAVSIIKRRQVKRKEGDA